MFRNSGIVRRSACRLALVLGLLAVSAPVYAGTYSDDFDDGTLAPWFTIHGSNSEAAGVLSGSNYTTLLSPSALINTGMGASARYQVSADMTISSGSGGLTLKRNGADFCAVYLFGQNSLWLATDSTDGLGSDSLADGDIGFVPFNLEFTLSVLVEGQFLTVSVDDQVVWSGTHAACDFTGSGEVGTFHRSQGASTVNTFSAVWGEADGDGDGYCPGTLCTSAGVLPGDCDDAVAGVSPAASEICDGIDNNCDSQTDEGSADFDGDGSADCVDLDDDGDGDADLVDCEPFIASIYTGAPESCDAIDSDCDGSLVDEFDDTDSDLAPDCTDADDDADGDADVSDCAPLDPSVHAGAVESCDAIDQDCDGSMVDEFINSDSDGLPDCVDTDDDDDGFPDEVDCGVTDASIYPNATESCDEIDSDCDNNLVDTFPNFDGDSLPDCVDTDDDDDGDLDVTDCNDFDVTVYSGAPEVVDDAIDQDCNGADMITCFQDLDDDNVGTATTTTDPLGNCDTSAFVSLLDTDCDDTDAVNFPGNIEVCDDQDNDCDASTEAGDGETDDDSDSVINCADCDDGDAANFPGNAEL